MVAFFPSRCRVPYNHDNGVRWTGVTGRGCPRSQESSRRSDVDGRKQGWMMTKYGHTDYGYDLRGLPSLPVGTRALARPPQYNVQSLATLL